MENASCPIDDSRVNKYLVRYYAWVSFGLLVLLLLTGKKIFLYVLAADYILRATGGIKKGLFCMPINKFIRSRRLPEVTVNALPKRFAVKVGLTFSLLLVFSSWFGWHGLYRLTLLLFLIAVGLDAFFDYCLACKFYSIFMRKDKGDNSEGIFGE